MLIYPIIYNGTTSSGAYSANTEKINSGVLRQIIIEFTTAGTTFNLAMTDPEGLTVFSTEYAATSPWRQEMSVPLSGVNTVAITNASNDEAFKGKIIVMEES